MIRDAVVHLLNEQPLIADLPDLPLPGDATLVCTNLRTMARKRPIFVDDSASIFVFPYAQIRFVELPRSEAARPDDQPAPPSVAVEPEDLVLDEELIRRVREL
jgi:hypothetical protein